MVSGKIILYVLFTIFIIQAEISLGSPIRHDNLQVLFTQALKVADCSRVVPVSEFIPLRHRRSTTKKVFQCFITLD
ncbi:unnamed protein product [Adineta steineri]|nr:unnamed protein product [Adineta steineri]CAF1464766.1 unnamed protein product [Adineta steineri]